MRNPSQSPERQDRVAAIFLRLLGIVFLLAFGSIAVQAKLLLGHDGLLPLAPALEAIRAQTGGRFPWDFPTLFWFGAGDAVIVGSAWAGAAIGAALALGLRSRLLLAAAWAIYLSLVTGGRTFFAFQWDSLLLETAFLALLLPMPWTLPRGRAHPSTTAVHVFLFRFLLFRLYFESGVAKLLPSAHGWRDLSALTFYFETAPLPTWAGYLAHQLPAIVLRALTGLTLLVEIGLPFLIFGPRRGRRAAFLVFALFQLGIFMTANYGFFNLLSAVISIWLLDDRDLEGIARRLGRRPRPIDARPPGGVSRALVTAAAAVLLAAACLEGAVLLAGGRLPLPAFLEEARALYAPFRVVNTYHLFAGMTERRVEVSFEGSDDGERWKAYRLRYKPGEPDRRPAMVAPHQPRVDFQLWFFTLSNPESPRNAYVRDILSRICHDPRALAGLWRKDPFDGRSPRYVRLGYAVYRFTDLATLRRTGAWWRVTPVGASRSFACADFPR